jgi:hypothetical protein
MMKSGIRLVRGGEKEVMIIVRRKKSIVLLLAIALIALILQISAVQSRPVDFRRLPFMEYGTVSASLGPLTNPPILDIYISGSGYATYLGKISIKQHHFVDITTMTFYGGTYTDTADNRDTIFGTYYGYLVPLKNGDLEIHGIFTIAGGTGRFRDVVGGGRAIGVQHSDNTAWLLLLGTICFE